MPTLSDFNELRSRLRRGAVGNGGIDTAALLSATLDATLEELADEAIEDETAILALGGYGRRELCLFSDVDIMVLHRNADPDRAVRTVLYPLWDANLKVGHSVRTVQECVNAARERLDTLTSLLSARLILGRVDLFEQLERQLTKVVSGRPLAPHLAALERERRQLEPYPTMAANVKSGRGGLRTFQALDWERRRDQLLGNTPDAESDEEHRARSHLLAVRNGLHAATGRAFEIYEFDLRAQVAKWLDSDVMTVSHSLCAALQLGDRLADGKWPGLRAGGDPVARWGGRVLGAVKAVVATATRAPLGPVATAIRDASAHGPATSRVTAAVTGAVSHGWTEDEREAFVSLISSGERGRLALLALQDSGWVGSHFPEWEHVDALPQLAPFHEHPLQAHLWRTVDEMRRLISGQQDVLARFIPDLGSTDVLMLAAFFHDIGKGLGGDHSELGANAAQEFMGRAGFPDGEIRLVTLAVKHHLLLPRTVTRRDIASRVVIEEVADQIRDVELLQVLYLLTIADSKATGRTMWSGWKQTLLNQFCHRLASRLGAGETPITTVPAVVEVGGGRYSADEVAHHLATLPPEYCEAHHPDDVVRHLDAISRLREATVLSVGDSGERMMVVGRDRRGFLLGVCRALAAHGVAVREARVFTRTDGIAVDSFLVVDDRSGERIDEERWKAVETTLVGVNKSPEAVLSRIQERASAYDSGKGPSARVRARPDLSETNLVLEVRAPDRVGLLVDIVEALFAEDLDLHLARIDTRAGEAIDVLHVDRTPERSQDHAAIHDLCHRLARCIDG